jgi:hypothetical protein
VTRRHYIKVAALLAAKRSLARHHLAELRFVDNLTRSLADLFAQDNPRFDRQRFYVAAGKPEADAARER